MGSSHALHAARVGQTALVTDTVALVQRIAPVLVFLVALTALSELADEAGVFDRAAHLIGRLSGGSTRVLVAMVAVLATGVTILLSLDTTAVLLTPAVLVIARQANIPERPVALLVLWLANTASLLLPVSNLTNLLAWERWADTTDTVHYLQLSWAPSLAAVVATVIVFIALHGRRLPRRHDPIHVTPIADRFSFVAAAAACVLLGPLVVIGVPAWLAATSLTLPVLAIVGYRQRHVFRRPLIPWRALAIVVGLFVLLALVQQTTISAQIASWVDHDSSFGGLLATAVVGAGAANAVNNLPAFMALESGATEGPRLMALLIGVNCGPLVTVWASMATILWRDRVRQHGYLPPTRTLAWQGALVAAASVASAVGALSLVT